MVGIFGMFLFFGAIGFVFYLAAMLVNDED